MVRQKGGRSAPDYFCALRGAWRDDKDVEYVVGGSHVVKKQGNGGVMVYDLTFDASSGARRLRIGCASSLCSRPPWSDRRGAGRLLIISALCVGRGEMTKMWSMLWADPMS
mmetsp:Transcript_93566/g.213967  ORF Transcript_93566/g.213967 Transcript_93566/m.213967 type:complete len:111 (+) Transcript_93566:70-402(+)